MDNNKDIELKRDYVSKQACFSQLTPEELDSLAHLLTVQYFTPDETIVTEGDPVDSVYLIVEGKADVRHVTIKDHVPHVQSLATLGEGAAIGLNETGFYSLSGLRTATVVAMTKMKTFRLSVAAFHGFALANHHVNEVMHTSAQSVLKGK